MIGRADIEFYEARLVMTVARSLVLPGRTWDDLSHRSKNTYLNRAIQVLETLLNDDECRDRLRLLMDQPARMIDPQRALAAFRGHSNG